jgi:hypothetical protein
MQSNIQPDITQYTLYCLHSNPKLLACFTNPPPRTPLLSRSRRAGTSCQSALHVGVHASCLSSFSSSLSSLFAVLLFSELSRFIRQPLNAPDSSCVHMHQTKTERLLASVLVSRFPFQFQPFVVLISARGFRLVVVLRARRVCGPVICARKRRLCCPSCVVSNPCQIPMPKSSSFSSACYEYLCNRDRPFQNSWAPKVDQIFIRDRFR